MIALLLTMMLYTTPSYSVAVEKDVPYATAEGYWTEAPVDDRKAAMSLLMHPGAPKPVTLEMDIYTPVGDDSASTRPLLLMMHGGSFFVGHKDEPGQKGWCEYFASLGYVAVSIDYRLGFRANRKDVLEAELRALEDADSAMSYLFGRDDLRIDPDRIFLAGTSAGAMTAMRMAFRENPPYRVRAVANLWGAVHDLSVLESARVPILSFQSTDDPVMPYDAGYPLGPAGRLFSEYLYGTNAIHVKARSLGIRSEHHPCPERRHRLHLDDDMQYTPRFYEIRDAMAAFFGAYLIQEPECP